MVNHLGLKFNRRAPHNLNTGRQTPSPRQFTPKTLQSNSYQANSVSKLELSYENYTAYVLVQLFDAFYLPWLKDCYGASFEDNFTSRLDHLNLSLETAFSEYAAYKRRIAPMAKRNAFQVLRKLKITIDEVRKSSNNAKHSIENKCLRVRIKTKNLAPGINNAAEMNKDEIIYYHSNYPICLHSNYNMFLDIPVSDKLSL